MFAIREAERSDVSAIVRVVNAAFDVERPVRTSDRTSPQDVQDLMERGKFFVAVKDARVIGAVFVRSSGTTGYFGMLAVDPELQRAGIGRALREHAEVFCRRIGCTEMTLCTGDFRKELLPYYAHAGYSIVRTEPAPPEWPASRPFQIVHMRKEL